MNSMPNKIIVLFLITLLTAGCSNRGINVELNEDKWSQEIDEKMTSVFEDLQKSKYDMNAVMEINQIAEDVQYLYVEEVPYQNVLDRFEEQGKFSYTEDFDFDNYWMIIAYGREIVELEFVSSEYIRNHYGPCFYSLSVTFGEEYFGDTVFFYRIKKNPDIDIVRTHYLLYANIYGDTEKVAVDMATVNRPKNTTPPNVG